MKTRILAILATLLLLLTCATFAVSADSTVPTLSNTTPVAFDPDTMDCPHCTTRVPSSQWTEFTNSTTSRTGHFKITNPDGLDLNGMKQFSNGSAAIWINTQVTAASATNAFRVGNGDTTADTLWLLGGANGVITGTGATTTGTNGGLMRTFADGTLHIGGALTIRLSAPVTARMAGLMDIYGNVIMHDGTLEGLNVADSASSDLVTYGAVVVNGGTFTMQGGRIIGGGAKNGAAVYVNNASAAAIIEGDAYIEGTGSGDNSEIYINKGSATIRGNAYIKGNAAISGSAIFNSAGTLTVGGGTVCGGIAENGGAIYLDTSAKFTMTGGTVNGCNITNDTTTVVKGGAVYTKATGANALTLTGGTINGGIVARAANTEQGITALNGLGGAIYIESGTVTLAGTAVTGGTAYQGGSIYMADGTLNVSGSTVSGGNALHNGGCITAAKGTLNISSGTVSGGHAANWGGNIYAGAAISITGGTITGGEKTFVNAKRGGNIYAGSTLTMSGGTVKNGTASQYAGNLFLAGKVSYSITGGTIEEGTSQTSYGGNLHIYNGTLTIADTNKAIVIRNGSATYGGNLSVSKENADNRASATVDLSRADSLFTGGSATNGAGIYTQGNLTLTTGIVTGGSATKGGAVYVADGTFTMNGGTLNGSTMKADSYGGTIYLANGVADLKAGTVNGGTVTRNNEDSSGRGGAIYVADGELHLDGADIVGGKAKEGGCLFIASSGSVSMTAGNMSMGDATSNGGAVFINGATMDMSGGTVTANPQNTYKYSRGIRVVNGTLNLSGNARVISAGGSEGNAVYAVSTNSSCLAKVTLADNASVTNPDGSWAYNIFMSNYGPSNSATRYSSKIEVNAGWKGTASVKFGYIYSNDYAMPGAEYSIGMQFPAAYAAATGDFSGQLRMETADGNPNLWWDGVTGLKASDVQICKKVDGMNVITWEKNNDAAVKAYDGGYIKLLNDDPIDLQGKEVYVDFSGNASQVTLSGGKLYGLDSTATAAKAGASVVTVTDGIPESYAENPVTGQHIITLPGEKVYTFHTVEAGIRSVSLRPGVTGIYYSADFLCDEVLKPYIQSFGVALSLYGMPDEDFESDAKVLYTKADSAALNAGSFNSVLVKNIMKEQDASVNKANGQMPIYASAYMKLSFDGQTYTMMANSTAQLSLKDVMQQIDKLWNGLDQEAQDRVISQIYDPYIAKFAENDWNLKNMEAEKLGLDANRELKVLTIGNSLSVDAGRMLAYVAQQEGSQGIKVGTLYKANCSVQEHADFLTNDKPNYWYYESGFDAENAGTLTTGSLVPSETKQYVGYNALVAEDWDIIVMQHSVFGSGQPETYDESIDTIIHYVNSHKTNPDAILVWNMTWMPPVDDELLATAEVEGRSPGFGKSYSLYTKDPLDREAQTMMYDMISGAVREKIHTDDRFAYVLPSATMMQNALTATSDKVMYRDYIHGSDYGRLMNAYLWYSMFTGKTITEPAVKQIPGALRFDSANRNEDLVLTQRMQDILVESVNNAKKNPFDETVSQYQKKESLKVLSIGNSFSQDAMWHLEEIARSEGYVDVKLGILYIGGSSLKTNWEKASDDLPDYQYYYNYDGNWENSGDYNTSIAQALAQQEWDIVTLQQASNGSGQSNTYEPYLGNLIEYVQTNEPDAKILWHMTWAYAQDSTHSSFPNYNSDQMTMYNAITAATQDTVVPHMTAGDISALIPSGSAIQNARTSYAGDEFDRDGYHLNINGRIVAAATWYSVLTGDTLDELSAFYFDDHFISGKPNVTLSNADREMIVEAVNNAIANPYQVTAFAN